MTTEERAGAAEPKLLPMPEQEKVRTVTLEANLQLYKAAREEMKKRRVTVRKIFEWGLANYLLKCNPEAARRLGIGPA